MISIRIAVFVTGFMCLGAGIATAAVALAGISIALAVPFLILAMTAVVTLGMRYGDWLLGE
jgi:hypothetical protein